MGCTSTMASRCQQQPRGLGIFARLGSGAIVGLFHTGPKNTVVRVALVGSNAGSGPQEVETVDGQTKAYSNVSSDFLGLQSFKGAKKLASLLVCFADQ